MSLSSVTGVRFARSGDVHVAYRAVGEGPVDLVYAQGAYTHLEVYWELPAFRRYCERLAEFTRLVLFDKRGMGMSDRVPGATTLEERMDDVRAVMDAVGSERSAVMGESEGGPLAMLFAAARARAWLARVQVHSNTPGGAEAFMRMAFDIDVRHVAPAINVPTLIVHAAGDKVCHVENGRFLSRTIPRARYVELSGEEHVPWFAPDDTLAEIREFLTGQRETATLDRVLATVLFTDLAGSTARASELGDRRWRDLLEQHHGAVRRELDRFGGREVDTAGDGFFATFDGPARAIRCARSIVEAVRALGLEVRAGLHTGEVELVDGKVVQESR